MARVESNSDLAIDVSVANGISEERGAFPPLRAVGPSPSRSTRPPSWSPPLPPHRVPVAPPTPAARSVSSRPAAAPSAGQRTGSTRPAPTQGGAMPGYPSSRPMPLPAVTRSTMRPVRVAASPSDATFRPRSTRARWVVALAAVSFVGGVIARDQVSADQKDRVRAEITATQNWIAGRVTALREMIGMGSRSSQAPNVPPSVEINPPKAAKTQTAANQPGSQALQGAPAAPPVVNVLSLPVAPPTAGAMPSRPIAHAPVVAAPALPVRAHSAPPPATADALEPAPEAPAPKAPEPPKVAAPTAAQAGNATPVVPGSLEDLIRKEVEKEQKKAH
jgi:hypothetical protein